MRLNVLNGNGRLMLRGAAVLMAGVAAGCSSGVSRFTSDMFTTASTTPQTQNNQSYYPQQQASPVQAAPSGTVQRSAMAPVSTGGGQVASSGLPPVSSAANQVQSQANAGWQQAQQTAQRNMQQLQNSGQQASQQIQQAGQQVAQLPRSVPAAASGTYTVASGDTLLAISRKTGVPVSVIQAANGMNDGNIRVGQTLRLSGNAPAATNVAMAAPKPAAPAAPAPAPAAPQAPAATQPAPAAPKVAQAKPADTNAKPASYQPPSQSAREIVEGADEQSPGGTGIGKMRWPVRGKVISGFGKGNGKVGDGLDISVPSGTSVKAAENGVVIYAGDGLKEFGNTVLVRHDDGLVTVYGHASELKVKRGQTVKRGQEIALSGASGSTESPKLHFEVRKNSAPVDPKTFLE